MTQPDPCGASLQIAEASRTEEAVTAGEVCDGCHQPCPSFTIVKGFDLLCDRCVQGRLRAQYDALEKHWISPNGVDHLIWRDKCVTCGCHHPEAERV